MFAFRCMKWGKSFTPLQDQRKLKSTFRRGVNFFFKKNLLVTNSITSGAFVAIGDLFQQEYEFQTKVLLGRYDWPRTGIISYKTLNIFWKIILFRSFHFGILICCI